jgi:hypothetical protein
MSSLTTNKYFVRDINAAYTANSTYIERSMKENKAMQKLMRDNASYNHILNFEQDLEVMKQNIQDYLNFLYKFKDKVPVVEECQIVLRENIPKLYISWELELPANEKKLQCIINLSKRCNLPTECDSDFISWLREKGQIKHLVLYNSFE